MSSEPTLKRAKLSENKEEASAPNTITVDDELIDTLWEHYRNFLDSSAGDDEDEEPDIDELQELIDIGEKRLGSLKKSIAVETD
ncbi:MAG: hypothetical protein SGARI_005016, partial [Bacillariaceae sp.]